MCIASCFLHKLHLCWTIGLSIVFVAVCLVTKSYHTLCNPMHNIACQAPLSMGFSRQEYWSGLPFPCLDKYYSGYVCEGASG